MIEIQIKEPGGPEVLVPIEASIPEPSEGQVLSNILKRWKIKNFTNRKILKNVEKI